MPLFAFLFYCPATAYPEGRELSTLANTAYLPAPCVYKKAPQSGAFPQFSKPSACSRSKQAHQTSGALEVECVKKTFQWNVFSTTVPSRKGERIARRLRGQAHQKKKDTANAVSFSFGALEGTRTPDLLVRSQSLYPAELQAHPVWCCFQSAYL